MTDDSPIPSAESLYGEADAARDALAAYYQRTAGGGYDVAEELRLLRACDEATWQAIKTAKRESNESRLIELRVTQHNTSLWLDNWHRRARL